MLLLLGVFSLLLVPFETVTASAAIASSQGEQSPYYRLDVNDTETTPTIEGDEGCPAVLARWSDEQLEEVRDLWNLTEVAQLRLRQLGGALRDVDHWKNDPFEAVRFLNEFGKDKDNAHIEKIFRNMIQWRIDNDMDTFMATYKQPPSLYTYSPLLILQGLDRDGDPVFLQRHGAADIWGLYQRTGPEEMLKFNLFLTELISTRRHLEHYDRNNNNATIGVPEALQWQIRHYESVSGHRLRKYTILLDLEGLNARQHFRPNMLFSVCKESARIGQVYYPGYAKRNIVIRAPKAFRMIWNVVQNFFHKRALDLFVFVTDDDYASVLDKYVAREHLPAVVDPEQGNGKAMPGYFETVRMEGGKLPPKE